MAAVELESSVWVEPPLMEVELLQAAVTKNIDKNLVKLVYWNVLLFGSSVPQ